MHKALALSAILIFALYAPAGNASTGWESNLDILWNITVTDSCRGEAVTFRNCLLVEQDLFWIGFIPNQSRIGDPHGKEIRINTVSGCTSVTMEEAD